MRSLGITQQALATALSCTRGAVGHYLAGRRTPSLQQLESLAAALETSPAWLLYGVAGGIGDDRGTYTGAGPPVPVLADTVAGRYPGARARLSLAAPDHCYAVTVGNDDYAPRARAGEVLLVDASAEPAPGDEVLVIYRDGSAGFHSYLDGGRGHITLDNVCGPRQPRRVAPRDIRSLQRVAAVCRGGVTEIDGGAAGTG